MKYSWLPLTFCGVMLGATPLAEARIGGLAVEGCEGCHRGGRAPMVTITADPPRPAPGASTTLTIRVPAVNGPTAGFYISSHGKGSFMALPGQSSQVVEPDQMVHNPTKSAVNGEVTFQMRWTAPAMPGGVDFNVWAVAANGDRARGGDGEGVARLSLTFGCDGVPAYLDMDGDGFGYDDGRGPTRVCALGQGYAEKGGDCNDGNKGVFPGAPEVCNSYDDNCNGMINEGLSMVTVYRDADGDGHGARNTEDTRMYCGNGLGYAPVADDCDDGDRAVHPGAMEICNGKDENCNGRVDDGARASCGLGWCRRLAPTCDPGTCRPGPPRQEICNNFDDDCDGVNDNGPDLCAAGETCVQGYCLSPGEIADAGIKVDAPPGNRADGGAGSSGGMEPGRPAGPDPRRASGGCRYGGEADATAWAALVVALAGLWRRRRARV